MSSALARQAPQPVHLSTDLEMIFARCFSDSEKTRLSGGATEPLYLPGQEGELHCLYYREDFFASALHEIAHWCIAGPERRKQRDFGYWYAPEGRNLQEQSAFEAVEVAPQALEWVFSRAAGFRFRLSADNLDPVSGELADNSSFAMAVWQRVHTIQERGLAGRSRVFFDALRQHYAVTDILAEMQFSDSELR